MKRNLKIAIWMAIAGTTVIGCVGAPLSASELALKRLKLTASEFDRPQRVTIRFNPARCECPAFEASMDGRWHRVEMSKDNEGIAATLESEAIRKGPGWTASVMARSDGLERKLYHSPTMRILIAAICKNDDCSPAVTGIDSNGNDN